MIAGLPGTGLSTLFYGILLLDIGAAKLYQRASHLARRIRQR